MSSGEILVEISGLEFSYGPRRLLKGLSLVAGASLIAACSPARPEPSPDGQPIPSNASPGQKPAGATKTPLINTPLQRGDHQGRGRKTVSTVSTSRGTVERREPP